MRNRVVGVVGGLTCVFFASVSAASPAPELDDTIAFELPDLEGEGVSLAAERFEGKIVLIDIWGTWCDPCRRSIPFLVEMQKKHGEAGLAIIGIAFEQDENTESRRARIRAFVEENGIPYTVLDGGDTDQVLERIDGLESFHGFPTMIILGRDGRPVWSKTGFFPRNADSIEKEIKAALDAE